MSSAARRPVVLVVLDGWGCAPPGPGNAVEQAATPVFDALLRRWPHTTLAASGRDVGLPDGQMGNSEVGHLNIGAGRVVPQDLVRLGDAVRDGSIARNEALLAACRRAAETGRPLHLMGLVSDGGVHSHVDHLRALARLPSTRACSDVRVHAITDGRDVSPHQAAGLLGSLEQEWAGTPIGIRTVSGRYYAMDRDGRWDRTQRYYATRRRRPRRHRYHGARRPSSDRTPPGSPTSSSSRSPSARTRATPSAAATSWSSSTSAPTARARSAAPWPTTASTASTAARRLRCRT